MGVGRRVVAKALAAGVLACIPAAWAAARFSSAVEQESSQPAAQDSQHKTAKAHHVTVEEEDLPSPEVTKAEEFIQKNQFADAEPLLKKAVESDPANYVAWFDLGFTENALGRRDESIAAYRKAVAAKPEVFESNLNLGLQLAKSGSPEAEQFLRAATKLKPTSHVAEGKERAWLSLAHVLEANQPEEAIAAYQQAESLQPKDAEPHLGAGLLLEKENKFSDAEHEYKEALALDPSSADAVTGLANIYMRGRRFPEAEAALRKVVAAHPDDAAAHIQLGRVLAAEGKNEDAISELQAGAKREPGDAALQRDLADLYVAAGKNEDAEKAYRALLATQPNDAALHDALGHSLIREKQFAAAQQEFLTAVKLKPDYGEAYGDLAFAASENKNPELALKALDARAKLLPENPVTYFMRASAYDHLLDVKKAVANYHLFLQGANGKYPEQEWQAKHRLIALESRK
jgi:tetratricopeptide (TPR) repeat protein